MSPVRRAVVAFPRIESQREWERVVAFRERHDPLARQVPPHVTLVFPFDDPVSNAALEEELTGALRDLPSFPIVLRGITAHEAEYLFLNMKVGNDAIIRLHDHLYRGVLAAHRSRRHTFVPHVTVGRLPSSDLSAALDASASIDGEIVGQVDAVSVYEISPVGVRSVTIVLPLDDDGAGRA